MSFLYTIHKSKKILNFGRQLFNRFSSFYEDCLCLNIYTRCVRKVSDLRLYLRARALDWPLRGMSVTTSPSRTL